MCVFKNQCLDYHVSGERLLNHTLLSTHVFPIDCYHLEMTSANFMVHEVVLSCEQQGGKSQGSAKKCLHA